MKCTYNATSQMIMEGQVQDNSILNVESFSNGIYYLKIIGKETATVRFIKN